MEQKHLFEKSSLVSHYYTFGHATTASFMTGTARQLLKFHAPLVSHKG